MDRGPEEPYHVYKACFIYKFRYLVRKIILSCAFFQVNKFFYSTSPAKSMARRDPGDPIMGKPDPRVPKWDSSLLEKWEKLTQHCSIGSDLHLSGNLHQLISAKAVPTQSQDQSNFNCSNKMSFCGIHKLRPHWLLTKTKTEKKLHCNWMPDVTTKYCYSACSKGGRKGEAKKQMISTQ